MTFQRFIIECRGDMTLKEASEKIGISLGYLRNLETGKRQKPSIDTLKKISEAYNCSLDELLGLAGGVIQENNSADSNEFVKITFHEKICDENNKCAKHHEIVDRFYDIGYILKHRERALYNGRKLTKGERHKVTEILKLILSSE